LFEPQTSEGKLGEDKLKKLLEGHDNQKNTPLHLAAKMGSKSVFEYLLDRGRNFKASTSTEQETPDTYGINRPVNRIQQTPLHECAKHNHVELIESLLSDGAKSAQYKKWLDNIKCENRMTCLHLACCQGHLKTVIYLVEKRRVSINPLAAGRETPLYFACEGGFSLVVEYLLNNTNADPTLRTSRHYNCLDIAIARRHPDIVKDLLKCSEWRTLMASAQYEGNDVPITPMRRLIISMPDIAYELIDKHFTTIIGGPDQPKHLVKYDYTFIDDHYNVVDWLQGKYVLVLNFLFSCV
ncbi:unnamed protein product, partial [Rotaria sp. Silwood2]